jgi:hypothetical protein
VSIRRARVDFADLRVGHVVIVVAGVGVGVSFGVAWEIESRDLVERKRKGVRFGSRSSY